MGHNQLNSMQFFIFPLGWFHSPISPPPPPLRIWLKGIYLHDVSLVYSCHLLTTMFYCIVKCKTGNSGRPELSDDLQAFNYASYILINKNITVITPAKYILQ